MQSFFFFHVPMPNWVLSEHLVVAQEAHYVHCLPFNLKQRVCLHEVR